MSPTDKTCTEIVGRIVITKNVDKSYNTMQKVTVLNVVPLQFQEKMLFSSDYYDKVRQCKENNGGNYCYAKYYNKNLPTNRGEIMLWVVFGIIIISFSVLIFKAIRL